METPTLASFIRTGVIFCPYHSQFRLMIFIIMYTNALFYIIDSVKLLRADYSFSADFYTNARFYTYDLIKLLRADH